MNSDKPKPSCKHWLFKKKSCPNIFSHFCGSWTSKAELFWLVKKTLIPGALEKYHIQIFHQMRPKKTVTRTASEYRTHMNWLLNLGYIIILSYRKSSSRCKWTTLNRNREDEIINGLSRMKLYTEAKKLNKNMPNLSTTETANSPIPQNIKGSRPAHKYKV